MKKIKVNSRYVTLKLTHEEVIQTRLCMGQANDDSVMQLMTEAVQSVNSSKPKK